MKKSEEISIALLDQCRARGHHDIAIPNFYVDAWEMDVCRITQQGQVTEFEIKTSRADFKLDFQKKIKAYNGNVSYKHESVKSGERCNRFYFVCPEGLLKPEDMPEGYGLIWAVNRNVPDGRRYILLRTIVTAQLLKKEGLSVYQMKRVHLEIQKRYANLWFRRIQDSDKAKILVQHRMFT